MDYLLIVISLSITRSLEFGMTLKYGLKVLKPPFLMVMHLHSNCMHYNNVKINISTYVLQVGEWYLECSTPLST